MFSLETVAKKLFGTQNDRELKSIQPLVVQINALESKIKALSNPELQAKTGEFKQRFANGETLDQLLPEAFAVVRESAWRVIGQRHYDVQLIGGVTLHRGRIAEMRTGEGKTLVATLPSYLNALSGKGVHVVTVNDYLARRDSEWMGMIHQFLGLEVGIIVHGLSDSQRKRNYGVDITYGTNNEFGFDYLRDNMKFRLEDYVQRELNFAIVDEVDSILIDEARTPLIISGPAEASTDLYYKIDRQIIADSGLTKEADYTLDEKSRTASLTEAGVEKMEGRLNVKNLYDPVNIELLHHVNQALRAHVIFKKDVDYVVRDGEVLIVDEFTGRIMPGRRWSDGLHQAIEAKESVQIENENQTLATITFQNYFRMYNKLSGMTGTADTEATEFKQIYKLDVSVIPTNRPMIRKDQADVIYKSENSKYKAIANEIKEHHEKGQPVLVGTISIEKSEKLSHLLKGLGIKHSVLNAKQHEREAEIVAQAGRKGAVTIATNMAGRGTDILLGGNPEFLARREAGSLEKDATEDDKKSWEENFQKLVTNWQNLCATEKKEVLEAGGLFILGTERHESRRIDNQLRGRSGRQGDPGESRFYLSLDDDLMRIFGSVKIAKYMEDDVPIEHKWISRGIENAQKKVEGHNYDIRKHLLEYDDVMNQQRQVIYSMRREVLSQTESKEMVLSMVDEMAEVIAQDFFPNGRLRRTEGTPHLDTKELNDAIQVTFQVPSQLTENDIQPFNDKGLKTKILELCQSAYQIKETRMTPQIFRQIEKMILLTTIDQLWKDHLLAMDHLRDGIGLQGYGQKDPLIEYKKQGFKYFQMMMNQITGDVVRKIFAVELSTEQDPSTSLDNLEAELSETGELSSVGRRPHQQMQYNLTSEGSLIPQHAQAPFPQQPQSPQGSPLMRPQNGGTGSAPILSPSGPLTPARPVAAQPKVGRNDPCPCGSGKKYKKCHGS